MTESCKCSSERGLDPAGVLEQILAEQRKTNHLLALLIQALADEGEIDADMPRVDLSGRPI
ncbi:hypothetical protein [Pseudomonas aeruginosa]|uniref:hypothetical protein n=1 Tax=Pseudomonas aeruginosa TaxID=287 RepID=UPI0012933FF7|nr:hypothetical protein [Pseudomonas aeruginosa]MCT5278650.1 hypothetical protein [Pseudomonas aeruginosa]QFY97827.1 hypothetical protein CPZ93_04470 [Pseudomonas aeruginosa]